MTKKLQRILLIPQEASTGGPWCASSSRGCGSCGNRPLTHYMPSSSPSMWLAASSCQCLSITTLHSCWPTLPLMRTISARDRNMIKAETTTWRWVSKSMHCMLLILFTYFSHSLYLMVFNMDSFIEVFVLCSFLNSLSFFNVLLILSGLILYINTAFFFFFMCAVVVYRVRLSFMIFFPRV